MVCLALEGAAILVAVASAWTFARLCDWCCGMMSGWAGEKSPVTPQHCFFHRTLYHSLSLPLGVRQSLPLLSFHRLLCLNQGLTEFVARLCRRLAARQGNSLHLFLLRLRLRRFNGLPLLKCSAAHRLPNRALHLARNLQVWKLWCRLAYLETCGAILGLPPPSLAFRQPGRRLLAEKSDVQLHLGAIQCGRG